MKIRYAAKHLDRTPSGQTDRRTATIGYYGHLRWSIQ